jgi:phage portal protein BeeE
MSFIERLKAAAKVITGQQVLKGITSGQTGPPTREIAGYLDAYNTQGWLHAFVGKIASTSASVQWVLKAPKLAPGMIGKSLGPGGLRNKYILREDLKTAGMKERHKALQKFEEQEEAETITDHPALKLLNDPLGELWSGNSYKQLVYVYKLLVGESFEVITRDTDPLRKSQVSGKPLPTRLWPVPPTWVQQIPTPETPYFRVQRNQLQLEIPYTEMLWDKSLNVVNPYLRGIGITRSMGDELDADESAAKLISYSFWNRGRPDVLVNLPGMKAQDLKAFQEDWVQSLLGPKNVNKAHFANVKDLDVKTLGENFEHLKIVDLRKFSRDTLRQILGIPPEIVGITESSNRSTIDAATYILMTQVIEPFIEERRAFLQKHIIDDYDPRLILDFVELADEDKQFSLQAARDPRVLLTVNEWRAQAGQEKLGEEQGGEMFMVMNPTVRAIASPLELSAAAMAAAGMMPAAGASPANPTGGPNVSGVPMIAPPGDGKVPGIMPLQNAQISAQTPNTLPPGSTLAPQGAQIAPGAAFAQAGQSPLTPAPKVQPGASQGANQGIVDEGTDLARPPWKREADLTTVVKAAVSGALEATLPHLTKEFREEEHPRDSDGRFVEAAGEGGEGREARPFRSQEDVAQIASEPVTKPSNAQPAFDPDPTADADNDGVTDAARVGVPADDVPPPPSVPRLPNLTEDERIVENLFALRYESNPDALAREYLEYAKQQGKFETDAAKMLDPNWNPPKEGKESRTDEETKEARARYNLALHQTANAIAKRAFLMHLDTLKPGDKVLVTVGGVGAGKGYALKNVMPELSKQVQAVWDSAGDQNATENPWVLEEAEKRGLKATFVYVHNDPKSAWAGPPDNPSRGVLFRANDEGRMVDAAVFADSYVLGARNHNNFYRQNKDKADFVFIDNTSKPTRIEGVPREALRWSRGRIHAEARSFLRANADRIKPAVKRGALAGIRIWPGLFGQSYPAKSLNFEEGWGDFVRARTEARKRKAQEDAAAARGRVARLNKALVEEWLRRKK